MSGGRLDNGRDGCWLAAAILAVIIGIGCIGIGAALIWAVAS